MIVESRNEELAKVMERIARIRELATRGGTQHEAEVAAAKMNALLLKYNLSLSDIDAYAQRTGRKVVHEPVIMRPDRWRQDLLFTVAEAHLCQAVRIGGEHQKGKVRMTVVGHEHNLIVVRETWEWLCTEVERLARKIHEGCFLDGDYLAVHEKARWMRGFRAGAVSGISAAYRAMREIVEHEAGNQWGIVPVLEGEVTQRFNELFPHTGRMRRPSPVAYDPFKLGVQAGKGINLGRQLNGASAPALA